MQKKNTNKNTKQKRPKKRLDPIVYVAILNGIFAIIVALINKLL